MEFYSTSDYRTVVNFLIEREKAKGIDCNYAKLAEAIRVQRPYFSKVMNKTADFSEDQLHLICEYFNVIGDDKNYLELLLQYSKSGLKERKDYLKKEINKFQSIKLDLKNNIEAEQILPSNILFSEYFLNPYMQIVHVALNIRRYQNLENLGNSLNLSKKKLGEILNKLELLKLIEFKGGKYYVVNQSFHLPKGSNLLHPHQTLTRIKSIEHQQNKSQDSENYAFSVTFSCDEEGRKKIQEDFVKYLKNVQKTVKSAGAEEVYQINFDLFSWTK